MVLLFKSPARVLVPVVSNTRWYTTTLKPSHQVLSPKLQEYPPPLALLSGCQPSFFPGVLKEHKFPWNIYPFAVIQQKHWAVLSLLSSSPTMLGSLCPRGRSQSTLLRMGCISFGNGLFLPLAAGDYLKTGHNFCTGRIWWQFIYGWDLVAAYMWMGLPDTSGFNDS